VAFWAVFPAPPGVHPVPFVATIWNIVLLVLLWFYRKTFPDNNLLLFSFLLTATIILQNYIARPSPQEGTPTPSGGGGSATLAAPNASQVGLEARVNVGEPFVWRTDHFLRQRNTSLLQTRTSSSCREVRPLARGGHSTGGACAHERLCHEPGPQGRGRGGAHDGIHVHCPAAPRGPLPQLHDDRAHVDVPAHLPVPVRVQRPWHPPPPIRAHAQDRVPDRPPEAAVCGVVDADCLLAGVCGRFAVYISTASFVLTNADTGAPSWVVALLWVVLLFYSLFGVVITLYYVPRLVDPTPDTIGSSTYKGGTDRDPWFATFDVVVFWLDVFSVVIKLTVAWTVYSKGSVVNCIQASCI
jgi:hypothetical protein